jgi:TRAP-type transport system small permease protein
VGKLVDVLKRISDILEKFVGYICMVLVAVMLTVVMVQVTLRAARASVPWSEELSRMLLIWIGMLGAGIAAKNGLHVGVDFLITVLPRKLSQILSILIKGTLVWFLFFFAKYSLQAAEGALRVKATTIEITMYFPKLALPVGSVLILIHIIYLLAAEIQDLFPRAGKEAL